MKIRHALLGVVAVVGLAACDADEPPTQTTPGGAQPTASDYTPATSGRAASESFQIEFSVSAVSSGRVARSDNYEIRLGKAQ